MKTIQRHLVLAILMLPLESRSTAEHAQKGAPRHRHRRWRSTSKTKAPKATGKRMTPLPYSAPSMPWAGRGGTVFVPDGTYMINAVGSKQLSLKSAMTLKLSAGATLKAIPNAEKAYSVLTISAVSNVAVVGGTLLGDRDEHQGSTGEWGMGIMIMEGAEGGNHRPRDLSKHVGRRLLRR